MYIVYSPRVVADNHLVHYILKNINLLLILGSYCKFLILDALVKVFPIKCIGD